MLILAIVFQPALSKADSKLGFEDKVKAYYTIEQDYSQELLNYNENKPFAIASLTKIMTYVLVMEDINASKYANPKVSEYEYKQNISALL